MYEGIGLSIHEVQIAGDWASIESVKVKNQPPDLTAGEFNRGE